MKFYILVIFALLSVVSIWGCAVKEPPATQEIREQTVLANMELDSPWRASAASSAPVYDNWLASFNDPQLDAIILEGLRNNPDLQSAALQVKLAAQYVELARAAMRPSVNIFGTGGINMGGGDVSSALQGISLGASWEPDIWGRMRYGRNAAQEQLDSTMADYEFARQSMAAIIAKAWFTATETSLQLKITKDALETAENLAELAEKRWQVGAGSEQDAALARADAASFRDKETAIRYANEAARRALELLLGRYPANEIATREDLPPLPDNMPTGLPIEMLERRPDMIAAEKRVAAAFNRVGEAKATRLPRIILNANVALIDSNVLKLKEDFSNPVGGAGAKLIAPVYRGGELVTKVEIRTIEQEQAIVEYSSMALRALGDVENSLAAGHNLKERRRHLELSVADNNRALAMARTSYRIGQSDLRAVNEQLLKLNNSKLELLQVMSEQLIQRVNLHLALGGSFELPPTYNQTDDKFAEME